MYYDTTNAGNHLPMYRNKTLQQNERILRFFISGEIIISPVGASEIWQSVFESFENVPLTSVRRALNTLARQGYISKTDTKLTGIYGRPEHGWIAVPPVKKQESLF